MSSPTRGRVMWGVWKRRPWNGVVLALPRLGTSRGEVETVRPGSVALRQSGATGVGRTTGVVRTQSDGASPGIGGVRP